ncbi:hypothetical protein D9M72_559370 [compost metagenome]
MWSIFFGSTDFTRVSAASRVESSFLEAALTEPESSVTLLRKSSIAPELLASAVENVSALPIVFVSGPRTSVTKPWMSVMASLARSMIWSAVASRLVTLD